MASRSAIRPKGPEKSPAPRTDSPRIAARQYGGAGTQPVGVSVGVPPFGVLPLGVVASCCCGVNESLCGTALADVVLVGGSVVVGGVVVVVVGGVVLTVVGSTVGGAVVDAGAMTGTVDTSFEVGSGGVTLVVAVSWLSRFCCWAASTALPSALSTDGSDALAAASAFHASPRWPCSNAWLAWVSSVRTTAAASTDRA